MKTAEEIKLNLSEKIWLFKDGTISHSECLSAILQAIQSPAPVMSAEPTVQQLREVAKNNPDTFLAGALYVIDNYKLNSPLMSAEQVELLEASKIALHTLDCIEFTRGYGTASKRLESAISKFTAPTVKAGISILTDLLAKHGGKIVSSNSLSSEWIEQARVSNRMYVDNNSLGYIWEPEFRNGMPETVEEVELFEWCYPLETKLPESLKEFNPTVKAEGWVSVEDKLPEVLETVWVSNGKGWTALGCRTDYYENDEGGFDWCWAGSNGIIYEESGKIVSECEEDDLDVRFWHPLPEPPATK